MNNFNAPNIAFFSPFVALACTFCVLVSHPSFWHQDWPDDKGLNRGQGTGLGNRLSWVTGQQEAQPAPLIWLWVLCVESTRCCPRWIWLRIWMGPGCPYRFPSTGMSCGEVFLNGDPNPEAASPPQALLDSRALGPLPGPMCAPDGTSLPSPRVPSHVQWGQWGWRGLPCSL